MGIEATGTIYRIDETQQVSDRFRKREFIVEITDNPKYPQHVMFQCTGDRCEQLDEMRKGDEVKVEFSLRGRLYTSKKTGEEGCFNSLDVWKVEHAGAAKQAQSAPKGTTSNGTPPPAQPTTAKTDEDDIPFGSCDIAHEPSAIAKVLR